jgi:hypothetical protein
MTTRRRFLAMAGGVAGFAVAGGAAVRAVRPAPPAVPDLLVAAVGDGLATVRGGRLTWSRPRRWRAGTRSSRPSSAGDTTSLTVLDAGSGVVSARVGLAGRLVPRVASMDGRLVALTGGGTTIVVADHAAERYRVALAGNYEPDAFALDGRRLFVLEWLPPAAPDRYRVRVVDLATGEVGPLLGRDKVPVPPGAEEEMRGERRQAAYGPDGATLYTLYTHQPDHRHTRDLLAGRPGGVHAFVHTLNLDLGWAYCLDLPEPFGFGPVAGHALAVADRLYVADATSGRLAVADSGSLTVTRVVAVPTGTGAAYAAIAPGGHWLYLGGGRRIHQVDVRTFGVAATWTVPDPVRGLAASADGARLYVGYPGGVAWRDGRSGAILGRRAVPGLVEVRSIG